MTRTKMGEKRRYREEGRKGVVVAQREIEKCRQMFLGFRVVERVALSEPSQLHGGSVLLPVRLCPNIDTCTEYSSYLS